MNNSEDNLISINDKDIEKKYISINNKDFIITTVYQDKNYGKLVKAITSKLKDFEKIYFKENGNRYEKITDEAILKYIYENYEKIRSDVIIDEDDDFER